MFGQSFSRLTRFERLLSLLTSVRPGEGRSVFLLLAQVYLLMFGYYLIRPLRDALILAEGSPEIRAYSTGAVAIALIFLIPLYKLLFDRLDGNGDKTAMVRWIMLFFVSNLLIFAFLVWQGIPVSVPFYIWVGVFSVMVVAQFWAFAADLFNIKTGQRLFAVIMVGAALGAISGGQFSGRLQPWLGTPVLMLLSAALLICVVLIGGHAQNSVPEGSRSSSAQQPADSARGISDVLGGFNVVARSHYLILIALFVMLLNWINSTGEYVLSIFVTGYVTETLAAAAGAVTAEQLFARFYGNYFSWIPALQLFIQLFLVSRIFRWFGVRGAILVLPLVMLANYGLVAMVPVFALVRLMMIIEKSTMFSIQSTTNHALYLPVTREEKYVGKTTIDTFFMRFGDLAYAGMIFLIAQKLGWDVMAAIYINIGLALLLLATGSAIGRYHKREILQNLVNLPPVVHTPLPDVYVPAGQMLVFSVPDQAFIDPDPGDTLSYQARMIDGGRLPAWIHFDRFNQTFSLRPPENGSGRIGVELVATDFEGLSIHSRFSIEYGTVPLPRFTIGAAATPPGSPGHGSADGPDTVPESGGYPS